MSTNVHVEATKSYRDLKTFQQLCIMTDTYLGKQCVEIRALPSKFDDNDQASILVTDHESWMQIYETDDLLNSTKGFRICFKRLIWNYYLG